MIVIVTEKTIAIDGCRPKIIIMNSDDYSTWFNTPCARGLFEPETARVVVMSGSMGMLRKTQVMTSTNVPKGDVILDNGAIIPLQVMYDIIEGY